MHEWEDAKVGVPKEHAGTVKSKKGEIWGGKWAQMETDSETRRRG